MSWDPYQKLPAQIIAESGYYRMGREPWKLKAGTDLLDKRNTISVCLVCYPIVRVSARLRSHGVSVSTANHSIP